MRLPGFIGPAYTLAAVQADAQRSVNLYPEADELGSGNHGEVACLRSTPGLDLIATVGVGPGRGGITCSNGRVFVVSGSEVYEGAGSTAVKRGDLVTASGPISMDDNGVQLIIVDGSKGYILDFSTNVFHQIADTDFPDGTRCAFFGGYFVTNHQQTQQFFISDLYDGETWNGLDFASAETVPDNVVSLIVNGEDLILAGDTSIEFWVNTGAADFPLERRPGTTIRHGIEAPDTLRNFDNTVVWLGKDEDGHRMVWRLSGYQAQRISTHAVETALQSYGDVSGATSFVYQSGGHTFYALNFEGANTTWVYDAATQMWHERTYTNAQGQQERHRANYHLFTGSTHIVGDYQNGNIYELTDSAATDNGAAIVWERTTSHTSNDGKFVFYRSIEFFLQPTSATFADLGEDYDPQVMLSFSDDGAHTWSQELSMSVGKLGEYLKQVRFNKMGRSVDRVWKLRGTFPCTLISASIEASGGTN